ncbi:MAG: PQQ-binding-like beta-propeller repeat protein, partial [Gemmatimonadota bacterium]
MRARRPGRAPQIGAASTTVGLVLFLASPLLGQAGTDGEWRYYGGDAGSTRYSALDQIDATNVASLEVAWRWTSANFGPRPEAYMRVTPLYVDGVVYTTAGYRRAVVAIDGGTGETLWMYRLDEGERGASAPRLNSGRGVAYWADGEQARIILISPAYHLVSLDAKTGFPDPAFGTDGVVDLRENLGREIDTENARIGSSSPAMVVGDVLVVGAALPQGGRPPTREMPPGHVRGYDVRTGELLWTFHTIPQPGEEFHDTWEDGSWEYTGNAAVWTAMSADLELGYVYLPVEAWTGDYYGGHRPGDNLFSQSVVALDAR